MVDGRKIAFTTGDGGNLEIHVVNADGSGQRVLARDVRGNFAPAWSPDGRRIAYVGWGDGNFEIHLMNADGSRQRRLTRNTVRDTNPVWSPDGKRIAFVNGWQVYVMNADGSGQRRLTRNGGRNVAPAWSPDGQRIVFERRVGRVKTGPCRGCGHASVVQVYAMNVDGSAARKLAQAGAQPAWSFTHGGAQPVWSPDGKKIAFARQYDTYVTDANGSAVYERQSDIYVMNADGSGQRNLTRRAGRLESSPVWSPAQKK